MNRRALLAAFGLALAMAGCATAPPADRAAQAPEATGPQAVLGSMALDAQLEARILALDPERVSDSDVRTVLAAGRLRAPCKRRRTVKYIRSGRLPLKALRDASSPAVPPAAAAPRRSGPAWPWR